MFVYLLVCFLLVERFCALIKYVPRTLFADTIAMKKEKDASAEQ